MYALIPDSVQDLKDLNQGTFLFRTMENSDPLKMSDSWIVKF